MRTKNILFSLVALSLATLSCKAPLSGQATTESVDSNESLIATITALASELQVSPIVPIITEVTPGSGVVSATVAPSSTTAPTELILPSATLCAPSITANSAINVRSGPGTVYPSIGNLPNGATSPLTGKSTDGTWWYISFPGGFGWVSGSVVTASCVPATLASIAAPPTPLPASGTCKGDYVYRLIKPGDKVCISPASKAQVEADNAAAESRKIVNVYGVDACISGYVWREAYSGDHVCVTSAVRSQVAADNSNAASRWTSGAYGSHTCIAGYVWREANGPSDDVCVTGETRTQTAADNAATDSRIAVNVYGMDACISGYVWRAAFSSDHVCVTSDVRAQTANDNAAAPAHTWP